MEAAMSRRTALSSLARLAPSVVLVAAASLLGGCYFARSASRPLPALAAYRDPGFRQSCLVIFVPGFLDGPDTYVENGFPRDVLDSGAPCDSVAVDLHFRYYAEGGVAAMLHEDVLAPAIARGYSDVWVVGISMGGLGASLLAREHPELIDGVILLSPFLGDEATIREIEQAGGLAAWHPPDPLPTPMTESNYTTFLWSFLRGYVDDPDGMPPLYIAWANGERMEPSARLLAAALPEGHVTNADGGHNWATWRPLFQQILEVARPGRRDDEIASR
jgi:pimeloyl-ACP methyl ester carboxylesterase